MGVLWRGEGAENISEEEVLTSESEFEEQEEEEEVYTVDQVSHFLIKTKNRKNVSLCTFLPRLCDISQIREPCH